MIRYIQVETDDSGEIVGLGFGTPCADCSGAFLKTKNMLSKASDLPQDASTKDHISRIKSKAYVVGISDGAEHAKNILAKHSGLDPKNSVEEHIAAIKSKARLRGLNNGRKYPTEILAKHSGLDQSNAVNDHIAAIKLKAYDEGYDDGRRDMRTDIQERMKQFEEAINGERKTD